MIHLGKREEVKFFVSSSFLLFSDYDMTLIVIKDDPLITEWREAHVLEEKVY